MLRRWRQIARARGGNAEHRRRRRGASRLTAGSRPAAAAEARRRPTRELRDECVAHWPSRGAGESPARATRRSTNAAGQRAQSPSSGESCDEARAGRRASGCRSASSDSTTGSSRGYATRSSRAMARRSAPVARARDAGPGRHRRGGGRVPRDSATAARRPTTCRASRREFKELAEQERDPGDRRLPVALQPAGETITERVDRINESLARHRLQPGPLHPARKRDRRPNDEVREFRADLRACTDDALAGSDGDQYSEQQVPRGQADHRALPRPRGHAEPDRPWTRRVTDVRNWFIFSASERAAKTTPSTSTTATPAASRAARRRSSPTRSWRRRSPTSSGWSGARRSSRTSGSRSSTRRSAAARTTRRGTRSSCSRSSACSC